jgi:hypothetical protein
MLKVNTSAQKSAEPFAWCRRLKNAGALGEYSNFPTWFYTIHGVKKKRTIL